MLKFFRDFLFADSDADFQKSSDGTFKEAFKSILTTFYTKIKKNYYKKVLMRQRR